MSDPSIRSHQDSVTVEAPPDAVYDLRTHQALDGIPRTLAAIKRIAESGS